MGTEECGFVHVYLNQINSIPATFTDRMQYFLAEYLYPKHKLLTREEYHYSPFLFPLSSAKQKQTNS